MHTLILHTSSFFLKVVDFQFSFFFFDGAKKLFLLLSFLFSEVASISFIVDCSLTVLFVMVLLVMEVVVTLLLLLLELVEKNAEINFCLM